MDTINVSEMKDDQIIKKLSKLVHISKKPLDNASSIPGVKLYLSALCMIDFENKGIVMTIGKEEYIMKKMASLSNEDVEKILNEETVEIEFPEEFMNL